MLNWIHIIWLNSGMQAEVALSIVLACVWTCAGNQIGTNCTAGAWIKGYAGNQTDP